MNLHNDLSLTYSKANFIKFIIETGALKFGEFTLKSGRLSPYFFNAGLFKDAYSLKKLGQFYANTLIQNQVNCEHLFGPAYKGIPLATATAIALAENGFNPSLTFSRKEIKNHGEGGKLIGSNLTGDTVIIDDVITAGTAFREAQALIREAQGNLTTVIIALDRCERGLTTKSTLAEIEAEGIKVLSIASIFDLISYLENSNLGKEAEKIKNYQSQYSC